MQIYEKDVKVGKTQRYVFNVFNWLAGGSLISASVTSQNGGVTLSSCDISNGNIGFFATGAVPGWDVIHITYATASQSDCDQLSVFVGEC